MFRVKTFVLAFIGWTLRLGNNKNCVITLLKVLSLCRCSCLDWFVLVSRMKRVARERYSFLKALSRKESDLNIGVPFISCYGSAIVVYVLYFAR